MTSGVMTGIPMAPDCCVRPEDLASLLNRRRKDTRVGAESVYASLKDFFGGGFKDVQRRYLDGGSTPDYARFQRVQEWGYDATIGVKGEF